MKNVRSIWSIFLIVLVLLVTLPATGQDCNDLPDENDFEVEVLAGQAPGNPWDLAVAPDLKVYYIGRVGHFSVYDPADGSNTLVHQFDVLWERNDSRVPYFGAIEQGLQGVALDPDFSSNGWIYFWYSVPPPDLPSFAAREPGPIERLSRFKLTDNGKTLDLNSEKIIYQLRLDAQCCHHGGDLDLGPDGNLWISTGDNSFYGNSEGGPGTTANPFRDDLPYTDARRTSSNTNDPRGKVLRITPIPFSDSETPNPGIGTTYNIPQGNMRDYHGPDGTGLWSADEQNSVLAEIYSMGHRNPVSLTVNPENMFLSTGEAAGDDNGYEAGGDEINVLPHPASAGWPFFNLHNMPYHQSELNDKQLDPENVLNLSPWNTGTEKLPPNIPASVSQKGPGITHNLGCFGVTISWIHFDEHLDSRDKFPSSLHNKLLFSSDKSGADIYVLTVDENGEPVRKDKFSSALGGSIISAEQGPDGALYFALGNSSAWDGAIGTIQKMTYSGPCQPITPTVMRPGEKFTFKTMYNPVTDSFIDTPLGYNKIKIFDVSGTLRFEKNIHGQKIEKLNMPGELKKGLFYVQFLKI